MRRTTVMLPDDLKDRAMRQAGSLGISLGEFIRDALVLSLERPEEALGRDPLLADWAVSDADGPSDMAADHDRYLYGD